jgi:chromosome segregation ATPase
MTGPITLAQLGSELARTQQALAASQQDLTRVERERDEAVEAFRDLTLTELSVRAELATTQDQLAKAVEQAALARAELASARQEFERYGRISAQVIRERNAWRWEIWRALGVDMLAPPPDAAEMIRNLRAQLRKDSPPNPGAGPREEHP